MGVRQAYRARWVFPVSVPPIENGVLEVQDGRITAVHDRADPAAQDLGNVAIIPGLVNAHTHLEFSDLTQPIGPAQPFTDWIRALVACRHSREETGQAVTAGKREAERTGTTCLGNIANPVGPVVPANGAHIVEFLELLGLAAEQHEQQLALARAHLNRSPQPSMILGLSPHAPYSVRPPLYHALVDLAQEFRCPLAIHLAETRAELELLQHGTGEFVELLRDFGVWDEAAIPLGTQPLDYLRPLVELEHALVIHGNYLNAAEMDFLADHHQMTVVYCPRTHAYFGHPPHPWRELLARGVSLTLGTDSRGSNPDLSLWRELQFLHARFPDVNPATLLELGTIRGATALGLATEIGTLTPGKAADLAVVALTPQEATPYESLFAPDGNVSATMCGGAWIA